MRDSGFFDIGSSVVREIAGSIVSRVVCLGATSVTGLRLLERNSLVAFTEYIGYPVDLLPVYSRVELLVALCRMRMSPKLHVAVVGDALVTLGNEKQ